MKTIFLVLALAAVALGATLPRQERAISASDEGKHQDSHEDDKKKEDVSMCEYRTPCGWAVYKRFTRQIDFFMKNSCECPSGTTCAREDDDISVSAYVYRCAAEPDKDKKKDEHSVTGEESSSRTS